MLQEDHLITNELQIDPLSHAHLTETAKWAKFIAIAGFIFSAIILVMTLYWANLFNNADYSRSLSQKENTFEKIGVAFYIVVAIVWTITSIYQLKFATKLQSALQSNYQEELQQCFLNFKIYYRISGIVTIISLLLMLLGTIGLVSKME